MPPKLIKPITLANGHGAKDQYELNQKLLNDHRDIWNDGLKHYDVDPMLYSRISVLAMTQLSAIVGVDVGMSQEQFLNVCRAQYEAALKHAPRFS